MGNNEECCKGSCETTKKSTTGCEMTDMMMNLADAAWEELMMEKIKQEFEKTIGAKMNKVALATANASIAHHTHMMEGKAKCEESKNKLREAFMS